MTPMSYASPMGFPPNTPHHGPPSGPAPRHRQGTPADMVVTIVLICLAPLVCLAASLWGLFSTMATASCGSDCGAAVNLAIPLMIVSPWVIWSTVTVWSIVRLVRKKPAVWVMLLGLVVATVIYVAANIMMFAVLG
ncbi:DUF6264 family protein [Nocardiopsis sp. JB363]|uniref:DUF6264 family protein n=1 Tax=Nocardiopsis sp. JB363 TaxID=1434837 RepID=UPI003517A56D